MRHAIALAILAIAALPASAGGGETPEGWNCRNLQAEISCDGETCNVAEAFTPMDIHLTDTELSLCAYTGCWTGAASSVTRTGRFKTYVGSGLPFSTRQEHLANASVTVDTNTGTATVLVANMYAHPATCKPWSPPSNH